MIHLAVAVLLAAGLLPGNAVAGEDTQQAMPTEYRVHPIGHVQKSGDRTLIVLDKKFEPGLLGLDQWSHVQVIWWFDKNDTPEKREERFAQGVVCLTWDGFKELLEFRTAPDGVEVLFLLQEHDVFPTGRDCFVQTSE